MADIFLPVWSNAGWFTGTDTEKALAARLKNSLILYDALHVQDGRADAVAWSEEEGFKSYSPKDKVPFDRSAIDYYRVGDYRELAISKVGLDEEQVIFSGEIVASHQSDFYPLLNNVGLERADFIKWIDVDLPPDEVKKMQEQALRDLSDSRVLEFLPRYKVLARSVIEGLYTDSAMAVRLKLPFEADARAEAFVRFKNSQLQSPEWGEDLRLRGYDAWLRLDLPDFSRFSWEKVCRIRESASGREFRRILDRIVASAAKAAEAGATSDEVNRAASDQLSKELIQELIARRQTPARMVFSTGLGLLPVVGNVATAVEDGWELLKEKRSWIARSCIRSKIALESRATWCNTFPLTAPRLALNGR